MNAAGFARMHARMVAFPDVVSMLVATLTEEDARWRPPSGAWSVIEIVNHLADEDVDDFGTRLRLLLESPDLAWPPIDPEGAATERGYNERDLAESLARFSANRDGASAWLAAVGPDADWETKKTHPVFGSMLAGELMTAWAAHDQLHLRQLGKRLYELTLRDAGGYSAEYAGAAPT
ncbi:DinB family protein [Pyruvatibacter sp.]|uniref:DinB family protein n=1 Tax=Pyruvatibacter sp. TaxID=1981328 RepID=UPI0032EC77C2